MVKTRSQTRDLIIKKEEEEDRKPSLRLNDTTMTTRSKITKREPPTVKNRNLAVPNIKIEEDTDIKPLLQSAPNHSKSPKGPSISQEQINQLIDYVVNDNMSIPKAARKVKIAYPTGLSYFNLYKNDSEKKIPSARTRCMRATQEQVGHIIRHIVDDKMTVAQASAKANLSFKSGYYYYKKYLKDPNHGIPIPSSPQNYTQDQKNEFIGYVVNDKMSIKAASLKANISVATGRRCYHKYFKDENPDIATPSHVGTCIHYTQEQIKEMIGYIVGGKMNIATASRKANMCAETARRHYYQYLKNHNMKLPVRGPAKSYTQDKINELIGYIINDKMNVLEASVKADIHYSSGVAYYRKYREEHNLDIPAQKCRQEQINKLIGYIVDDKMTIIAASKKANVSNTTGYKYYRQYLKDQKR